MSLNEVVGTWFWCWGGLTVVVTGVLKFFPAQWRLRSPCENRHWGWRLLRGELAIAGSLRAGIAVAAVLWWCGVAGVLTSDMTRCVLALFFGGLFLVSLVNAGRRARLSTLGHLWLGGGVSAGGVVLILIALRFWQGFAG